MTQKKSLSSFFAPRDMTTGTPWKRILNFCLPMLVGNIFQQLYNTVDAVVVGHYIGDNALAAVGSAGPLVMVMIALFFSIASGVGIMVSQYFGAKQREDLSHTIGCCLTIMTVMAVAVSLIGPFFARPGLELLGTPPEILDWCADYVRIIMWGAIGMAYYNILSGILRGLGDAVSSLLYLIIASLLNVVLDILFVSVFHMGVAGVAWATIIAQAVSGILCLRRLMQLREVFTLNRYYLRPSKKHLQQILRLGLPTGISQVINSMSMMMVQSLANTFGAAFIACNVIVMRVDSFVMMPVFTFGAVMMTYTGQNVGAQRQDRVQQGLRQCLLLATTVCLLGIGAVLIFGRYLMMLFTDTTQVIDMAMTMMKIMAAGYMGIAIGQVFLGFLRGSGETVMPMWITSISSIVIRIPLAYLLVHLTKSPDMPLGRPESLFISLAIAWISGAVMSYFTYKHGKWRKKGLIKVEQAA